MDAIRAKFEITELISRYGNCLDSGAFDEMESLFTEDAVFRIEPDSGVPPLQGGRGIRAAVERRWALVHAGAQRRHVMSNIVVESFSDDGSSAQARTVLLVYEVAKAPGSQIHLHGMGVYEDRLVRVVGKWRFRERRLILDRRDYFAPGWTSTQ